jgi:hypothetical protein
MVCVGTPEPRISTPIRTSPASRRALVLRTRRPIWRVPPRPGRAERTADARVARQDLFGALVPRRCSKRRRARARVDAWLDVGATAITDGHASAISPSSADARTAFRTSGSSPRSTPTGSHRGPRPDPRRLAPGGRMHPEHRNAVRRDEGRILNTFLRDPSSRRCTWRARISPANSSKASARSSTDARSPPTLGTTAGLRPVRPSVAKCVPKRARRRRQRAAARRDRAPAMRAAHDGEPCTPLSIRSPAASNRKPAPG